MDSIRILSLRALAVLFFSSAAPAQVPPHIYSFGSGDLARPHDVAIFAAADGAGFAFVTSPPDGVVRFPAPGSASSVGTLIRASATCTGIAVNDTPGHCRFGDVYVGTGPIVEILDTSGNLLTSFGAGFLQITGVACALDGTVYVVDRSGSRTYGFLSTTMPSAGPPISVPPDFTLVPPGAADPLDVAVDQNGVVYVTHTDGTVARYDGAGVTTYPAVDVGMPWGIDASDTCATQWITQSPLAGSGTLQGYLVGLPVPTWRSTIPVEPRGLEFDKFARYFLAGASISVECRERLFVVDQGPTSQVDVFGSSHFSATLPSNAVAWWSLNERQPDCGGPDQVVRDRFNVVNGALFGGSPPRTREGMVGLGYEFGGAGSGVTVPAHARLDFGAGAFTIEAWVLTTQATGLQTILDKRANPTGLAPGYHVYVSNGVLGIQLNAGGTWTNWSPAGLPAVSDGKWHHFAFVMDAGASSGICYLDGTAFAAPLAFAGSTNSPSPLLIGVRSGGTAELHGRLDELTMYSRALTALEVGAIWGAHCAGKSLPGFAFGESYCASPVTTNGCVPTIATLGVPSVSASSGFWLVASSLEGQKQGLVFYGLNGRLAAPWGAGSTSFLCVRAPTQRMPAQGTGGFAGQCDGSISIDWSAYIATHPTALGNPMSAGQVVNAQAWFRDPPAPKTTNLTDGVEFTLEP